jgi:hypothetical protein
MDRPDSSPYNFQKEPGVTDATYQDFIAPLLAGLGVGKVISAGARSVPIATKAIQAGLATKPIWSNVDEKMPAWMQQYADEIPAVASSYADKASRVLSGIINRAYNIGDWANLKTYRLLQNTLNNSPLSDDEVDTVMKHVYELSNEGAIK